MAITFTQQGNVPPSSTNSLTADGEGMHSWIPLDLVYSLNNLGTYVNNHWHYAQASAPGTADTSGTRFVSTGSTIGTEYFLTEFPVFIPLWAVRMVWTAGARCVSGTQTAVKVYLSRAPYIGSKVATFDTSLLTTGYKTRSVTVSLTAGQYSLADDSSTGITPIDDNATTKFSPGNGLQTKRKGYVVLTGVVGASSGAVSVEDFSLWFLPS